MYIKFALSLAIIVMFLDIIVPFVLSKFFYKDYSNLSNNINLLGCDKSSVKLFYNIWSVIAGVVFILFAIAFYLSFESSNKIALTIMIMIMIYGIGNKIVVGFFPASGDKEIKNFKTVLNAIGSSLGFFALLCSIIALTLLNFAFKNSNIAIADAICCGFSLLYFSLFVLSDKSRYQNTIISYEGLWQRLAIYSMYIPFVIQCFYLLFNN